VGKNPKLFPINKLEAVDIDEMEDFIFAEFLMKKELSNE
jgi:CMP-N-acetylneuraminic acid synthetase